MKLIALSGKRGSGKTSCANYLKHQYGATVISLAAPIKEELVVLGFDKDLIYTKPSPEPIRALMIALGQARRYVDPDYFVNVFLKKLAPHYTSGTGLVVCDDCRFLNEAEKFASYDASLIRVECPDILKVQPFVEKVDDDISEISLDEYDSFDYVIRASHGSITAMHEQLDVYLRSL